MHLKKYWIKVNGLLSAGIDVTETFPAALDICLHPSIFVLLRAGNWVFQRNEKRKISGWW